MTLRDWFTRSDINSIKMASNGKKVSICTYIFIDIFTLYIYVLMFVSLTKYILIVYIFVLIFVAFSSKIVLKMSSVRRLLKQFWLLRYDLRFNDLIKATFING